MRRARHENIAVVRATFTTPPSHPFRGRGTSRRNGDSRSTSSVAATATEVFLLPNVASVDDSDVADQRHNEQRRQLAVVIRQRIESRLAGRVRDLSVRVNGGTIILEGHCVTYHTKQLAQHAALGVLEDEHLVNEIVVAVPH